MQGEVEVKWCDHELIINATTLVDKKHNLITMGMHYSLLGAYQCYNHQTPLIILHTGLHHTMQ